MNLKSRLETLTDDLSGRVEHLPERAERARKVVNEMTQDMTDRAATMFRTYPLRSVLGAFAIGFIIAKVAKHA